MLCFRFYLKDTQTNPNQCQPQKKKYIGRLFIVEVWKIKCPTFASYLGLFCSLKINQQQLRQSTSSSSSISLKERHNLWLTVYFTVICLPSINVEIFLLAKKTAAAAASSETKNNIQFECAQFLNIQNEIRYTKGHTF